VKTVMILAVSLEGDAIESEDTQNQIHNWIVGLPGVLDVDVEDVQEEE
jgi:hypothetical protein